MPTGARSDDLFYFLREFVSAVHRHHLTPFRGREMLDSTIRARRRDLNPYPPALTLRLFRWVTWQTAGALSIELRRETIKRPSRQSLSPVSKLFGQLSEFWFEFDQALPQAVEPVGAGNLLLLPAIAVLSAS